MLENVSVSLCQSSHEIELFAMRASFTLG